MIFTHLKEQGECFGECLKVVYVVESVSDLDVFEEGHPEDGEDEHDKEQEEADVDQGGEGHDQREEQGPYPLGALDEAEDSADFGHSHHSQQGWGHEVLLDKVT